MYKTVSFILISICLSAPLMAQTAILEEVLGDLDGDNINERVVIYTTATDSTDTQTRAVHIFKGTNTNWELWQELDGGILPASTGVKSQEPFVSMEIKAGQLVFYHAYSGEDQWNYSHHFRFYQNKFELVRAKISFGALCEAFTHIDFDLLTGLLSYKQETDNCSEGAVNQVLIDKKELVYLDELPLLSGFIPGDNEIKVPGTDLVFYY